jgi:hypothetical protein
MDDWSAAEVLKDPCVIALHFTDVPLFSLFSGAIGSDAGVWSPRHG